MSVDRAIVLDTLAAPASYVFWGGLVLVPLSTPFLNSVMLLCSDFVVGFLLFVRQYEEPPEQLTALLDTARRTHKDEEFVVLSAVIADELTIGMEDAEGSVLKTVNGTKVLNLKHVHSILTSEVSVVLLWCLSSCNGFSLGFAGNGAADLWRRPVVRLQKEPSVGQDAENDETKQDPCSDQSVRPARRRKLKY